MEILGHLNVNGCGAYPRTPGDQRARISLFYHSNERDARGQILITIRKNSSGEKVCLGCFLCNTNTCVRVRSLHAFFCFVSSGKIRLRIVMRRVPPAAPILMFNIIHARRLAFKSHLGAAGALSSNE